MVVRKMVALVAVVSVLVGSAGVIEKPAPVFTSKPTVTKEGKQYKIEFAVKEYCDVTVAVVDKEGRIVRHLASGLLGDNAAAPLEKDTLAQSLVWDGEDEAGRPAPRGSCVRLSLGCSMKLDRVVEWESPSVLSRGIAGMAAGPGGTLYVLQGFMFMKNVRNPELVVFARRGEYLRTLVPFPANLPPERISEVKFIDADGRRQPVSEDPNFLPGLRRVRRQTMCLKGDRIVMVSGAAAAPLGSSERLRRHLLSLGLDGSTTGERYLGPALPGHTGRTPATYVAASSDGAEVYVAGLRDDRTRKPLQVVYRAHWGDAEVTPFLGVANQPGADEKHFNGPRGLAVDANGRLWVSDFGNDRIQVFTPEGELLKSLPVKGPEQLAVHPRTGLVYVLSVKPQTFSSEFNVRWEDYRSKALLKFASLERWEQVASLALPERPLHMHDAGPILCLDASGNEPVIWVSCVGRQEPEDCLWCVVDRGGTLERIQTPIRRYSWPAGTWTGALAVDRQREVLFLAGPAVPGVLRVDGRSGEVTRLEKVSGDVWGEAGLPRFPTGQRQVTGLALDGKGRLYLRLRMDAGYANWIRRYDRSERLVPFAAVGDEIEVRQPSHGFHPSTLAVSPGDDIYVVNLAPDVRFRKPDEHNVLDVYGDDGALKKSLVMPWLSSGVWGPRLGPHGALYFTEALRPRGYIGDDRQLGYLLFSPPFNSWPRASETRGSLLKFSPQAPGIRLGEGVGAEQAGYEVRETEKKHPPAILKGAEWVHYGVSPVPLGHCVCPAAAFDVDGYGRAVVPDAEHFQVKLLDAAGNLILSFGAYGNRDSRGPHSAVPEPDLPLYSPLATAISDEAVYVYDALNRRVLRAVFTCKREAEVAIPD